MTENKERRKSFRILETALVRYQILDDADFDAGIARWRLRSGDASQMHSKLIDLDARLDELMYRASAESPAASDVLRLLNDKINIVAQGLPEFEEARKALASQAPRQCELSSEGIRIGIDEKLAPETGVMLQLLVLPENRYFESFAQVTRVVAAEDTTLGSYKYQSALQFHGMSAAEQENLIQYLFMRQSETLRLRRIIQDESD